MKKITLNLPLTTEQAASLAKDHGFQFPLDIMYLIPKRNTNGGPRRLWSCGSWGFESNKYLDGKEGNVFHCLTTPVYIPEMDTMELFVQEFSEDEYVQYVIKNGGTIGTGDGHHPATDEEIREYYRKIKAKTQE